MALKLNFREITPEDTRILRMVALRNGKAEDYLCCDVTNEDGVTRLPGIVRRMWPSGARIIYGRTPQ